MRACSDVRKRLEKFSFKKTQGKSGKNLPQAL
jgi:virulence-associated protein VapD